MVKGQLTSYKCATFTLKKFVPQDMLFAFNRIDLGVNKDSLTDANSDQIYWDHIGMLDLVVRQSATQSNLTYLDFHSIFSILISYQFLCFSTQLS